MKLYSLCLRITTCIFLFSMLLPLQVHASEGSCVATGKSFQNGFAIQQGVTRYLRVLTLDATEADCIFDNTIEVTGNGYINDLLGSFDVANDCQRERYIAHCSGVISRGEKAVLIYGFRGDVPGGITVTMTDSLLSDWSASGSILPQPTQWAVYLPAVQEGLVVASADSTQAEESVQVDTCETVDTAQPERSAVTVGSPISVTLGDFIFYRECHLHASFIMRFKYMSIESYSGTAALEDSCSIKDNGSLLVCDGDFVAGQSGRLSVSIRAERSGYEFATFKDEITGEHWTHVYTIFDQRGLMEAYLPFVAHESYVTTSEGGTD